MYHMLFSLKKLHFAHRVIYVFRVILRINIDFLPKQD
jgi:hypothetical protein